MKVGQIRRAQVGQIRVAKSLLVLTHRRFADRNMMVGVASGWHSHLAVLVERLKGREPAAFWAVFSAVNAEYERQFPTQ